MTTTIEPQPAGFVPWPHRSPVLDALGPFARHEDDPLRAGFVVTANKLNSRGFLHAGVVSAFADVVIGHALSAAAPDGARYVTVSLSCEYLDTARLADWVDAEVTRHKIGRRVASGTMVLARSASVIATAHALFLAAEPGR